MHILLQVIGSLASIGGIPLAIYLYLRSREAKYTRLRQEIVKILSFQIGEGRKLSIFEVQAVIDSKLREHKLRQNSITVNEATEDLVAETISSPMLESQRKEQILANLQQVHQRGHILSAIDKYGISYKNFIHGIQNIVELSAEDSKFISKEVAEPEAIVEMAKVPRRREAISTVFALLGVIATLIAFMVSIVGEKRLTETVFAFFKDSPYLLNIVLGILASLVAGGLTALFALKKKVPEDKQAKEGRD